MGQPDPTSDSGIDTDFDYNQLSNEDRDDLARRIAREIDPSSSRRNLLRGLGVAGISAAIGGSAFISGTRPASANPDEQDHGSSSSPIDVYASNVYGPHGTVDFQAPIDAGEVTSGTINDIVFVEPSESIQSAIDSVGSWGHVALWPGATYQEDKIEFTEGLTFHGNRAEIEITQDNPGLILKPQSHIHGYPFVHVTHSNYTRGAILVSTNRTPSGDDFGYTGNRRHVQIDAKVKIDNTNPGSRCILLTDPGNGGLTFCRGNLDLEGGESALHMYAGNSGFVNGNYFNVIINGSKNQIAHTGAGGARSVIHGILQPGSGPTDRMFYNNSDALSFCFRGQPWDPTNSDVSVLEGRYMNIQSESGQLVGAAQDALDSSLDNQGSTIWGFDNGGLRMLNCNSGKLWNCVQQWGNPDYHHIEWTVDHEDGTQTKLMTMDYDGNMRINGSLTENASF